MIVTVPENNNAAKYIDGLMDGILSEDIKYNVEWDSLDGIS